ncbi:MAG: MFS transporter [Pirellulaceae bacterium]
MDCLATPTGRKFLFGLLYLSEGAPIGFIWLGLPTRLRAAEVELDRITWLMALLILPWTLKFLWAPLIDLLRGSRWGFKQWILLSQSLMALCLLPLMWLDIRTQFSVAAVWLLLHAIAAATQDISIDALCVQQSQPDERASLNGWMQCGVLVGRAAMGGGSLVLEHWIGFPAVVGVLIALVMSSSLLLWFAREHPVETDEALPESECESRSTWATMLIRLKTMFGELAKSLRSRRIWAGFLIALSAPAAFKSLEAVLGPYLIDRNYSELQIGNFSATVMIGGMIIGSLLAGHLAGRVTGSRFLAIAIAVNLTAIVTLAVTDHFSASRPGWHLMFLLALISVTIGWLTVAMYQWLMNLTSPQLAATQFTAFMAATNACEAWSTAAFGNLQSQWGYPAAMITLCGFSALATLLILGLGMDREPANTLKQPTSPQPS